MDGNGSSDCRRVSSLRPDSVTLILPRPGFETIDNFRDFGGFSGRFGRVKTRRLYRSAHLAAAGDADLHVLGRLGPTVIVDLRRPAER